MKILHLLLYIFLNSPYCMGSSSCLIPDRAFNCDCIVKPGNVTLLLNNGEPLNASSTHFIPAVQSLKYCDGSFHCKTNRAPSIAPISASNYFLCFSEISCLIDEAFGCSCMRLQDLQTYYMINNASIMGNYTCIKVSPDAPNKPYCLRAACRRFTAIERWCSCDNTTSICNCSLKCDTVPHQKTYVLYFSFGDIYVLRGHKNTYVHWLVVVALFIGLTFLLLTFCKLCERVVDTRRAPSAKSTSAEDRQISRIAPPPSYEQVMKDKCIEFKRSVAKTENQEVEIIE